MFKAALFIRLKKWKQLKYPSIGDWMDKMWYIYTMEYYLVIKRNETPTHTSAWMNSENIMPPEETRHKDHISFDSISIKCQA
jgi:hypothetical protein